MPYNMLLVKSMYRVLLFFRYLHFWQLQVHDDDAGYIAWFKEATVADFSKRINGMDVL